MPTLTMRRSFVLAIAVATGCGPAPIDAVMSWDEYVRIEHPTPYIVRRTREHGELLYFGARHVREPGDPQVAQIQELWSEFRPTVLLYEGPTHPAPTDLSEAIAARGEGGVVRWLATTFAAAVNAFAAPGSRSASLRYWLAELAAAACRSSVMPSW